MRSDRLGPLDPIYDVDVQYGAIASGNSPGISPLFVTINQASSQLDPAVASPILFDVVFSEDVTGFATGDVTLSGTVGGTLLGTVTGSDDTYTVTVTGMTTAGTLIATIAAGVCTSVSTGTPNFASSSTDNEVTWDPPTLLYDWDFSDVTSVTTSGSNLLTVTDQIAGKVATHGGIGNITYGTLLGQGAAFTASISDNNYTRDMSIPGMPAVNQPYGVLIVFRFDELTTAFKAPTMWGAPTTIAQNAYMGHDSTGGAIPNRFIAASHDGSGPATFAADIYPHVAYMDVSGGVTRLWIDNVLLATGDSWGGGLIAGTWYLVNQVAAAGGQGMSGWIGQVQILSAATDAQISGQILDRMVAWNVPRTTPGTGPPSGGTITTSGGYTYHTYTTDSYFDPGNEAPLSVEYCVVSGGGGGGRSGGGGGGVVTGSTVISVPINALVGAGGAGGGAAAGGAGSAVSGKVSTLQGIAAPVGGGRGVNEANGAAGGSGGGAGIDGATAFTGGAGTAGQGNNGGTAGGFHATFPFPCGGGGGAGAVGGNATSSSIAGNGGTGVEWPTGSGVRYGPGGGGAVFFGGTGGTGGSGGGGNGGASGTAGTANKGAGGGGAQNGGTGGAGGSGVIIIRYPTP